MSEVPRLRMFAGPNGSGKSVLKNYVSEKLLELAPDVKEHLGYYINADELLKELRQHSFFPFSRFNLPVPLPSNFTKFFTAHPVAIKKGLSQLFAAIQVKEAEADFSLVPFFADSQSTFHPDFVGNYLVAILADWIRQTLIDSGQSFTFETVMSGEDKVKLLEKARHAGYRIYLYFVTTKDVKINIGRVSYRVTQGGHNVPEQAIKDRYTKSLKHLKGALRYSYRAYLFDNSAEGEQPVLVAELVPEGEIIYRTNELPDWYLEYVEGQKLDSF